MSRIPFPPPFDSFWIVFFFHRSMMRAIGDRVSPRSSHKFYYIFFLLLNEINNFPLSAWSGVKEKWLRFFFFFVRYCCSMDIRLWMEFTFRFSQPKLNSSFDFISTDNNGSGWRNAVVDVLLTTTGAAAAAAAVAAKWTIKYAFKDHLIHHPATFCSRLKPKKYTHWMDRVCGIAFSGLRALSWWWNA